MECTVFDPNMNDAWELAEKMGPPPEIPPTLDNKERRTRFALELDSTFKLPHMWLMQTYEHKGMYAAALAEYRQAAPAALDNPRNIGNLGHLYASMGNRDEARRILHRLCGM